MAATLRANAGFLRVFLAGITSQSGRSIALVALPWLVFTETGSPLDVAYVGLAELLSTIAVTLPAGVWVDRYDRRGLMVLSDVLRAAATGVVALALFAFGFGLVPVLALAATTGGVSVLFNPARQSLLPDLLRPDQLADANGLIASSENLTSSAASAIAGALLAAVGAAAALAYTSVTFLVSAALVVWIALPAGASRRALGVGRPRMGAEIVEGFRWLYGSRGLFQLSVSALPMNFFSTIVSVFLVVFATESLHGNALTFGGLVAATSLGSAAGALLVGRTRALARAGQVWVIAYGVVGGAALIAVALAPVVPLVLLLLFAFSAAASFAGTTWLSAAQAIVPGPMQGRYFAVDGLISWVVLPMAQIVGAILIAGIGISTTYLLAGIGLAATGITFTFAPDLWHLRAAPPKEAAPTRAR